MTATTVKRAGFACMHCPNSTASTEDAARFLGWRIWEGTTMGGKQKRDVVCPKCAGTEPPPVEPEGRAWNVGCDICGWDYMSDEAEAGEVLSEDDARGIESEHRCEPETWVRPVPKKAKP